MAGVMNQAQIVWDRRGGATVMRDGHAQSYVDPEDPLLVVFEYIEQFTLILEALRPDPAPLAITHVGGAGMTLPRWVHRVHPGSPQIVLEPDAALTELVRSELPLPRGHRIRVRQVTGQEGITGLKDGSAEIIVVDAFDQGRYPAELAGQEWARQLARVLRPDGLLLVNAADRPGLQWLHRLTATLRTALPQVGLMLLAEVAKGRRYGNAVIVASGSPLDDVSLHRAAARATFPSAWRSSNQVARSDGAPFGDLGEPSPAPPGGGLLNLR